ncbi:MAG TPA: cytochrome c [Nitrospira sp.]|nr:cytochrome c [Nitrospira sp.]
MNFLTRRPKLLAAIAFILGLLPFSHQALAAESEGGQTSSCVQPRKTASAPEDLLAKTNPLPASSEVLQAGKGLYLHDAKPMACALCHGKRGEGKGPVSGNMVPPARDFSCGAMMREISDGQLFWITKNGSPSTGMMAFPDLSDEQVWQLVHYMRSLVK